MLQPIEFDIDQMARLAVEAPARFALVRETLIRAAIATFDNPEEGERLQAEIDASRDPQCCDQMIAVVGSQLAALEGWASRRLSLLQAGG